jgi:DtxR family Mn-dependent transcriptional regulator
MPERDDEILELIWIAQERKQPITRTSLEEKEDEPFDEEILQDMERDGLVKLRGEEIALTDEGGRRAAQIIRRHRLAERLMRDVLEMKEQPTESAACEFEHILSVEVMESICTLLGHPKKCPHGHAIPPGECCPRAGDEVRPVVAPLNRMKTGTEGTVAYIATHHHHRLDKLAAFGLLPGVKIRLHQRQPSFVIEMGETTLAIDEETAADIYVRQAAG